MKTAIIIHGMPDKEEYFNDALPKPVDAHWLPWLKKELESDRYTVHVPAMPEPYEPNYEKWKAVFEQLPIDEHTVLIGHSCGAGFLVRWLTEHKVHVGSVVLIAPWMDPEDEDKNLVGDFFDFVIDPTLAERTEGITIFVSSDDYKPILQTVEMLEQTIKDVRIKRFEDKGHFTAGDGMLELPEVLAELA